MSSRCAASNFKDVLPIQFFNVRANMPPKAPFSLLCKLAMTGYILVIGVFLAIVLTELTRTTIVRETVILPAPDDSMECTALGSWSNKASDFNSYMTFKSTAAMHIMHDISMTSEQCFTKTSTRGICAQWAESFVGTGACCVDDSTNIDSPCFGSSSSYSSPNSSPIGLCGGDRRWRDYKNGMVIFAFNDNPPSYLDVPILHGTHSRDMSEIYDEWDKMYKNVSSTARSMVALSAGSYSGGLGSGFGSYLYRSAEQSFVLNRDEFIDDCNSSIAEICSRLDEVAAPFACVKENIQRKTWVEALATSWANTQLAMTIIFMIFGALATKLHKEDETVLAMPAMSTTTPTHVGSQDGDEVEGDKADEGDGGKGASGSGGNKGGGTDGSGNDDGGNASGGEIGAGHFGRKSACGGQGNKAERVDPVNKV